MSSQSKFSFMEGECVSVDFGISRCKLYGTQFIELLHEPVKQIYRYSEGGLNVRFGFQIEFGVNDRCCFCRENYFFMFVSAFVMYDQGRFGVNAVNRDLSISGSSVIPMWVKERDCFCHFVM